MIADTIVTDLDDTLLDIKGEISDFTLGVLRQCLEKGIRVIPASGRAQASMEPYVRRLNTGLPYIACNGAQLVNADHSLIENLTLPLHTAREICVYLQERDFYVQAYRGDSFFYAKECAPSLSYKRSSKLNGEAVGDLLTFLTFGTPKLLCISEPERIAELYPKISARFEGQAVFSISHPSFLEVEPLEGSKGAALKRLAARIGIDPKTTYVFGDSLNDLSMLAFTEHSVAMGNARDEVKKAARYICGPNSEDGLARFVLSRLLNGIPEGGQHHDQH